MSDDLVTASGQSLSLSLPRGIRNPGSLCYLIAVLQPLFLCRPVREDVLALAPLLRAVDEDADQSDELRRHALALRRLVEVFESLAARDSEGETEREGARRSVSVLSFYKALQRALRREVDVDLARDASEALGDLCRLLGRFRELVEQRQRESESESLSLSLAAAPCPLRSLRGELHTTLRPVRLLDAAHYAALVDRVQRRERFFYLSLDVAARDAAAAVHALLAPQFFPFRWRERESGALRDEPLLSEKRVSLAALPALLALHVKRFSFSAQHRVKLKLHERFEFPLSLALPLRRDEKRAVQEKEKRTSGGESEDEVATESEAVQETERESEKETERETEGESDTDTLVLYDLAGVTVHIGETAYAGHYYHYHCQRERDGEREGEGARWLRCDDDRVCALDDEEEDWAALCERELFGRDDDSDDESEAEDESESESESDSDGEGEGEREREREHKRPSAFLLWYERRDAAV